MLDAIKNISNGMLPFCNSYISDEYVTWHPYKQYFLDKVDVITIFDLVYKIFIENGGKVSEGFGIGKMYKGTEVK